MKVLALRSRQKTRDVDLRFLRQITRFLLEQIRARDAYELGIHIVDAEEMARINETFLQHAGSTDVITFDHSEEAADAALHGEIFISMDDAVAQARQFRTTWQAELARYVIHGVLHLEGFDDLQSTARKRMKSEENRILKKVSGEFALGKLHRQGRGAK